jgi:uncharacterized protein
MNKQHLSLSSDETHQLTDQGFVIIKNVVDESVCDELRSYYTNESLYRKTITMQRYRFGLGEYKYFSYPLPPFVQMLRQSLYAILAPVANDWMEKLALPERYPDSHEEFITLCHAHQQKRPTPLILHYTAGGYNTLHQDLYGQVYFPLQVIVPLSQYGRDYDGGELVLTHQVPRAQSRAMVVRPNAGDAVIITTNFRPVAGTRGYYKINVKHGVSTVVSGERYALGIIFHDAS